VISLFEKGGLRGILFLRNPEIPLQLPLCERGRVFADYNYIRKIIKRPLDKNPFIFYDKRS
jgi:hypothetical protein